MFEVFGGIQGYSRVFGGGIRTEDIRTEGIRGIPQYYTVFAILRYFTVFDDISRYSEVFCGISHVFRGFLWYFAVFRGISRYFAVFRGIQRYSAVFSGIRQK